MERFAFAVALLSLFALPACAAEEETVFDDDGESFEGCTAMACEDGLNIQFSVSEPGAYLFNIVADGASISCSATLPLPDCSSPGSTCGDPRVQLAASGCALSPDAHSLEGLSFVGMQPQSVSVLVTRDAMQVASQTFTPAYQTVAPNGDDCGPVCRNATVSLSMSGP